MIGKPVITYSEERSWIICRQQHYWAYQEGYTPKDYGKNIRIGSVVHEMLDYLYNNRCELAVLQKKAKEYLDYGKRMQWYADMEDEDYYAERAAIIAMLTGYHVHYFQQEDFQAYLPEMEFALDFGDFILSGKIDGVVRKNGYRLHEIKTKSVWGESDREMLRIDDQVTLYLLALMAKWRNPVVRGYYSIIKKPGTKPNLKREYSIVSAGTGQSLTNEFFRLKSDAQKAEKDLKKQTENYDGEIVLNERKESPAEYEERLVADYLARPEHYFDRVEVSRTREEIQIFIEKIRAVVSEIGKLAIYRTQGLHCGWCDFRDICLSSRESQELALQYYFLKKDRRHSELKGVEVIPAGLEYIYRKVI